MGFLLKLIPQFIKTVPSASNTTGTALGTLASGVLFSYMNGALWVPPIAAAFSITPAGLTSLAVLGAGMIVSYLVTHIAEAQNLNDLVAKYMPVILEKFPTGKNGQFNDLDNLPVADAGPNTDINKPAQLPDNVASHTVSSTVP